MTTFLGAQGEARLRARSLAPQGSTGPARPGKHRPTKANASLPFLRPQNLQATGAGHRPGSGHEEMGSRGSQRPRGALVAGWPVPTWAHAGCLPSTSRHAFPGTELLTAHARPEGGGSPREQHPDLMQALGAEHRSLSYHKLCSGLSAHGEHGLGVTPKQTGKLTADGRLRRVPGGGSTQARGRDRKACSGNPDSVA